MMRRPIPFRAGAKRAETVRGITRREQAPRPRRVQRSFIEERSVRDRERKKGSKQQALIEQEETDGGAAARAAGEQSRGAGVGRTGGGKPIAEGDQQGVRLAFLGLLRFGFRELMRCRNLRRRLPARGMIGLQEPGRGRTRDVIAVELIHPRPREHPGRGQAEDAQHAPSAPRSR